MARAPALADRGRPPRRVGERAADGVHHVPRADGLLPAEDGARDLHPQRGRRRSEELFGRGAGAAPAGDRAGLQRVRVARQPHAAGPVGHAVLRRQPAAVPVRAERRAAHRHRLLPVARHLQRRGDRAALVLCGRPVYRGAGQARIPADWRRQQPGRLGGVGSRRAAGGAFRRAPAPDWRRRQPGFVRGPGTGARPASTAPRDGHRVEAGRRRSSRPDRAASR